MVTPFHTFATCTAKYDIIPNMENKPRDQIIEAAIFLRKRILGNVIFKPKSFEATRDKILSSESRKSNPGPLSKEFGCNVSEVVKTDGFRLLVEETYTKMMKGIYKRTALITVMGKNERKK